MAQKKQRKQLILTNDKNIFSYCFHGNSLLQPNFTDFTVDGIRNIMAQLKQRKKLILPDSKNILI